MRLFLCPCKLFDNSKRNPLISPDSSYFSLFYPFRKERRTDENQGRSSLSIPHHSLFEKIMRERENPPLFLCISPINRFCAIDGRMIERTRKSKETSHFRALGWLRIRRRKRENLVIPLLSPEGKKRGKNEKKEEKKGLPISISIPIFPYQR